MLFCNKYSFPHMKKHSGKKVPLYFLFKIKDKICCPFGCFYHSGRVEASAEAKGPGMTDTPR